MNLNHLNLALALSLALSVFIPLISAFISDIHLPQEVTGLITLAISLLNGFVLEWSHATDIHNFDWRDALGTAAGSWLLAGFAQLLVWSKSKSATNLLKLSTFGALFVKEPAGQHEVQPAKV